MRSCILLLIMLAVYHAFAQQPPITQRQEQVLEELAEKEEATPEDDSFIQQLEILRKHPIHLNIATADELQSLQMLTDIQVKAFLQYRQLLGNLLHLYELQAIPHWDISTIQRILPYVTIHHLSNVNVNLFGGSSSLLIRIAQAFGRSEAGTITDPYLGSPQKLLVRYRYNYKDFLQFGWLADKDAGEPMFREKQGLGFDFYSFHLFFRKRGLVRALAIGDYVVNLGQGLIHWQSLSFRKSSEVITVKRQSPALRPYTSAGEYNFHRGVGISLRRKGFELTAFGSYRKLSANLLADSTREWPSITSFLFSGLHRTASELAERNNIKQYVFGGSLSYDRGSWHLGGNIVHYRFSNPVVKREEPYNFFSFKGRNLFNYSFNYDFTWRNLHTFGEIASGQLPGIALIHGLLISLDRKLDVTLVIRKISPGFHSFYSTAFTENSLPINESGVFAGLSLKPVKSFTINIYADIFRFPWLKFRVDGPSVGREYLVLLYYQPNKKLEINTRFRFETKQTNYLEVNEPLHNLVFTPKTNWRMHVTWHPEDELRLRKRVELLWFDKNGLRAEQGYLMYTDITYSPLKRPYSLAARLQFFDTDGFNSKIFAFENDIATGYSIPAVYQKGFRYYINVTIGLHKIFQKRKMIFFLPINMYVRWSQTTYKMQAGSASGPFNGAELKLGLILL